jgi:magnesium-transporting ATPase (P-type)
LANVFAGKIRYFCFDKTGTLTKSGLDFYGAASVSSDAASGFAHVCVPQRQKVVLEEAGLVGIIMIL